MGTVSTWLNEADTFLSGGQEIPIGVVDEIAHQFEKACAVGASTGHAERVAVRQAVSSIAKGRFEFTGQEADNRSTAGPR